MMGETLPLVMELSAVPEIGTCARGFHVDREFFCGNNGR